jgi:hypothetical protein
MSKLIELLNDAYPFGCKGDVVKLTNDELADLEKLGKKLNVGPLYKDFEAVTAAERAAKAVEGETVDTVKAGKK